jgi:hypothetical protein
LPGVFASTRYWSCPLRTVEVDLVTLAHLITVVLEFISILSVNI